MAVEGESGPDPEVCMAISYVDCPERHAGGASGWIITRLLGN